VPRIEQSLPIQILKDSIETFLELFVTQLANGIMGGIVINVGKQYCLRERWFDMFSRTTVAVTASSNFVIERTIHSVLLCTKNELLLISTLMKPTDLFQRCSPKQTFIIYKLADIF
jgi:hypothetical protein